MLPPSTLFLFSTNSWLSFVIGEEFYGSTHFVWCTNIFDTATVSPVRMTTPPTSTPKEIYHSALQEVSRGDRHSAKIEQWRNGLLRGAEIRHSRGEIDDGAFAEVSAIIGQSAIRDFRPLLYVISYAETKHLVHHVPVHERAHPLSQEFRIERLPRDCFEVLDMA